MRFGLPEIFVLLIILLPLVGGLWLWRSLGKRARRFGYSSTSKYLRMAPRSDAERRDAADLALRGMVWCGLGLVFAPCVLIGLVPLFYGSRKLTYASLGLGLVDDAE